MVVIQSSRELLIYCAICSLTLCALTVGLWRIRTAMQARGHISCFLSSDCDALDWEGAIRMERHSNGAQLRRRHSVLPEGVTRVLEEM
ncbi:unnamed protein product [Pleuronectes platessa]|uniref:Uncharacterized protein n=1 Tax=Pleuronectes platessa TaxID=8262 RepID=A0A9N7Z599_PLEPL|nr:unnamed protein product [Pleuronectes platessa]